MKLLIVAATRAELGDFFVRFNLPEKEFIENDTFDLLITGVGMTATAFQLGQHLNQKYDLVLNVGIAGSFDLGIPLGSLISVETDIIAELGAEDHDQFIAIDELGFGENTFKATYSITDLPKVKAITVNKVHGNAVSIASMKQRLSPEIESMEGAAVFYACNLLQVKCAQVRSVSNYVEPRARENWKIGLAIKNLNEWLINFVQLTTTSQVL